MSRGMPTQKFAENLGWCRPCGNKHTHSKNTQNQKKKKKEKNTHESDVTMPISPDRTTSLAFRNLSWPRR